MNLRSPGLRRAASAALRLGAVLLLLGVYLWGWRPARFALVTHAAHPLLASAGLPQAAVTLRQGGRAVHVAEWEKRPGDDPVEGALPQGASPQNRAPGAASARAAPREALFEAPAGVRFLLPALFLVAAFPRRPYWLFLWGAHLAAGAVALAVLAGALAGWGSGWGGYHFWTTAGLDLFSLLVPLWLWLHGRQGRFLPHPAAPGSPPSSRGAAGPA